MKTIVSMKMKCFIFIFFISISAITQKFDEISKLVPEDGAEGDFFGNAVATNGEVAVVGAWFKNNLAGAAYVFRRDEDEWAEEQKLVPSDASSYDFFGCSVDVFEDYVIIGASGVGNIGAAYIFKYNGNSWVEIEKLTPSNGALYDQYGSAVSIHEDYAVVGSRNAQTLKGAVYIYQKSGNTWTNEEMLTGPLYATSFGCAVDMSEESIIVGASDNSYAFVFMLDGNTWVMTAELEDINGSVYDEYGQTVSIDGNLAVVGATHHQNGNGATGAAYIYKRQGSNWVEEEKLVAEDGQLDDHFGIVSMFGNTVIVGSYSDDDYGLDAGSAYIYQKENNSWIFKEKLFASDGFAGDEFGSAVAVFSDIILIGAPDDNDNGSESGSAYVFKNESQISIEDHFGISGIKLECYPNPFSENTTIKIQPVSSGNMEVDIFNANGICIRNFSTYDHFLNTAFVIWDGTDNNKDFVKPGAYYCRLITDFGLSNILVIKK